NGNVYVTGSSYDSIYGSRTTTIKYKQFNSTLNITGFVQGFYNAATNTMISDTATIFLRSTIAPYNIVDSSKGVLNSSGAGVFYFSNVIDGVNYYIVFKHRNSIETWSAAGHSFSGSFMSYNFSTSAGQAYGSNMIQVDASPLRFAVYSGDVNQSGSANLTDILSVYNDATSFAGGYINTDVNGSSTVNLSDLLLVYNNASGFVSKVTPP
ncbi:MAG: hypothetical protein ABI462_02810, partial [Ignavibacteria bacterium]